MPRDIVMNSIYKSGKNNITMQDVLTTIYPIGSLYTSFADSRNPAVILGFGTWESLAGKVVVGVDPNDTDFNAPNKTGGAKAHTLTEAQLPVLNGAFSVHSGEAAYSNIHSPTGVFGTSSTRAGYGRSTQVSTTSSNSISYLAFAIGGNQAHNNLPPYITAYMWRRTV